MSHPADVSPMERVGFAYMNNQGEMAVLAMVAERVKKSNAEESKELKGGLGEYDVG